MTTSSTGASLNVRADVSVEKNEAAAPGLSPSFVFDGLTGLRFFAAFFVFFGHADKFLLFDPTGLVSQMSLGVSVTLFFVLSGFVLTHAYDELVNATAVKDFLVARLAKIWPIHAVTLFFFLFALKIPAANWDLPSICASLCLVQDWIPLRRFLFALNTPSWSLSAELFFYLLFPILIAKRKQFLTAYLIGAYIVTACLVAASDVFFPKPSQEDVRQFFAYWSPLPRVADFILGMQTYVLYVRYAPRLKSMKLPWTMFESITMGSVLFWLVFGRIISHKLLNGQAIFTSQTGVETWLAGSSPAPLCAVVIFLVALQQGIISRFLASKLLIEWGDRSYALYMVHYPLLSLVLASQVGWTPVAPSILLLAVLVLTFASSDFLYRVLEIPARQFIRANWTSTGYTKKSPIIDAGVSVGKPSSNIGLNRSRAASIAFTSIQAILLAGAILYFYCFNQINHSRQPADLPPAVSFSGQYILDNGYWERDAGSALLELNWRAAADQTASHQVTVEMLGGATSSKPKMEELPMEDAGYRHKNETLTMRLYFPLDELKNKSVGITVRALNPDRVCLPDAGVRDLHGTRLIITPPKSFVNLSSVENNR